MSRICPPRLVQIYSLCQLILMFFYFAVTMTEAYETLQGKSEESEEYFEEKLLHIALGNRERMAATKYVAGYITYKVYKLKISQHSV